MKTIHEFEQLRAADVRKLLRLVNEMHDLAADPALYKERMLSGLCRLVGARVGASCMLADVVPGRRWKMNSRVDVGLAGAREREAFAKCFRSEAGPDPMEAMTSRRGRPVVTMTRRQTVDDAAWYASKQVEVHRRAAGIDDCIYSLFHLPKRGSAMGLMLHREWGDPRPFTDADRLLVHLLHVELGPLYQREVDRNEMISGADGRLSTRMRETLSLLLGGSAEKEVAIKLGLSRHTVHVHVRSLYRHFKVNSRAELLARFVPKGSVEGAAQLAGLSAGRA